MITLDSHLKTALSTTDHWTWAIANENKFAIQTKKPRKPHVSSKVQNNCSEKLQHLSRFQLLRRKKKTIAALKPIHCGSNNMSVSDDQSVQDGLSGQHWLAQLQKKWWKLISLIQLFAWMIFYPRLLKGDLKNIKKGDQNQLRSIWVLYEGGMVSKRKYTNIQNSSDVMKQSPDQSGKNKKSHFMQSCEISKILPYKPLMSYIRNIDIGEVVRF